ncbi:MAG: HupE/UreJ family protein [Gammaproteobacteria bacterium]
MTRPILVLWHVLWRVLWDVKWLISCCILLSPRLAFSHEGIVGVDNFYDGLFHPLFEPSHLLLPLSTGLFFGQQQLNNKRIISILFLIATTLGLFGSWFFINLKIETFLLIASALTGLLIAAHASALTPLMRFGYMGMAVVVGLSLGFDSAQETLSGTGQVLSLCGSGISFFILLTAPMLLSSYFNQKNWQKIGIRVMGSWIAASSVLVLTVLFTLNA